MDRQIISPLYVLFGLALLCIVYGAPPIIKDIILILAFPLLVGEAGQALRIAGQLAAAEFCFSISAPLLKLLTFFPGKYLTDLYITSSNQLEFVLSDRQKYSKALALANENIELLAKRHGRDSIAVGCELICKAYVLGAMGSNQQAIAAAEEALQILEKCGDLKKACMALNNLGTTLLNHGEIEKGCSILSKSLKLKEQLKLPPFQTAVAYGNVGYSLLLIEQFANAEEYLRKATSMTDATTPIEFTATVQNNLGEALRGQGKYVEAEELLLKSLDTRQKHLTKTHPHLGYSYHNLGKLMADKNQLEKAEVYFQKAVDIRSRIPGEKQITLNQSLKEQVKVLKRLGKDSEAAAIEEVHKL